MFCVSVCGVLCFSLWCSVFQSVVFCVSVCDVLPLLLGCPQLQVSAKYLYRLLAKCIEFFVCYVTQPTSSPDQLTSPSPGKFIRSSLTHPGKPSQPSVSSTINKLFPKFSWVFLPVHIGSCPVQMGSSRLQPRY